MPKKSYTLVTLRNVDNPNDWWTPCVLCTVYCVLCTVYCVLCTVYCVLCTVYCVLCTVYCVLCTVYCVLCTVYCVLCTVYCVLCTVYCVLCTVYCVLCTVYCVLCTVYCAEIDQKRELVHFGKLTPPLAGRIPEMQMPMFKSVTNDETWKKNQKKIRPFFLHPFGKFGRSHLIFRICPDHNNTA